MDPLTRGLAQDLARNVRAQVAWRHGQLDDAPEILERARVNTTFENAFLSAFRSRASSATCVRSCCSNSAGIRRRSAGAARSRRCRLTSWCISRRRICGAGRSTSGAGIGYYEYKTSYFYQTRDSDLVYQYYSPHHVFRRPQLSLFAEGGGVLTVGSFEGAIRAAVDAGSFGGVREDWLPLGETISSGALALGAQAGIRFRYPYRPSVTPYGGLGLDITS